MEYLCYQPRGQTARLSSGAASAFMGLAYGPSEHERFRVNVLGIERPFLTPEGPVVCEEEVGEAAAEDGEQVGRKNGKAGGVDEKAHQDEVSCKGDEAVGEVKAQELWEG